MRILGIDPGYAIVGFGVLEYNSGKFTVVDYGAITTSSDMDFNRRLKVTDKAVSRWERGMGFPDIQTLEPLAERHWALL